MTAQRSEHIDLFQIVSHSAQHGFAFSISEEELDVNLDDEFPDTVILDPRQMELPL